MEKVGETRRKDGEKFDEQKSDKDDESVINSEIVRSIRKG